MGQLASRRHPGYGRDRGGPDRVGDDHGVPDALLVLIDRPLAGPGRDAPERRRRLRLRCDAKHRRVLLRGRRCSLQSEGRGPVQGEGMTPAGVKTVPLMGTLVTIQVVGHDATAGERGARDVAIERAFDWFRQVEACCSRFDPSSEVRRLSANIGIATTVSEMLFRAIEFACALAAETDGAFDPTVGGRMAALGFDRHYRTSERTALAVEPGDHVSYRDVEVDLDRRTITVARPLQLDLGAVAKGLAIDLAAPPHPPPPLSSHHPGGG